MPEAKKLILRKKALELTVPGHALLFSPAWPLRNNHPYGADSHIFLLSSQVTAFGCSLCRCAGFLHTSAYQGGRESCLAKGPGSAGVLHWQLLSCKSISPHTVLGQGAQPKSGLGRAAGGVGNCHIFLVSFGG